MRCNVPIATPSSSTCMEGPKQVVLDLDGGVWRSNGYERLYANIGVARATQRTQTLHRRNVGRSRFIREIYSSTNARPRHTDRRHVVTQPLARPSRSSSIGPTRTPRQSPACGAVVAQLQESTAPTLRGTMGNCTVVAADRPTRDIARSPRR